MGKNFHRGTLDQFEAYLADLVSGIESEIDSSTDICASDSEEVTYQFPKFTPEDRSVARRDYNLSIVRETNTDTFASGAIEDIRNFADEYLGYELVPDYFVDNINSCDELDVIEGRDEFAAFSDERYLHNLIGDVQEAIMNMPGNVNADDFDYSFDTNTLTFVVTTSSGAIEDYSVPFEDLSFDFDSIDNDVDYIVDEVKHNLQVESCTDIYSADEGEVSDGSDDESADTEFGDPSDIQLSGDTEADFQKVVDFLESQSYEELGDALNDVVSDPKLYKLLSEGFGNGELADVKMSSSPVAIPVKQLLPSQSEIGLNDSLRYPLGQDCSHLFSGGPITIVAPIITYRKSYVIDGHHRWSQVYMLNPDAKISALNFNYNEDSPFRPLRNFQGAIAVAHKGVPSSAKHGINVYDASEDEIRNYIDENIQDACWQSIVNAGKAQDRDGVIDYITNNVMQLKNNNPPFANAPDRQYMPQTDDKAIDIAEIGQTNI